MVRPPLFLPALLLGLACRELPTGPGIQGQWGGRDASLLLTKSGGTLAYACGSGTIDSGWLLTSGGHFQATGLHFFGGGPLPDTGRTPHPARYAGELAGEKLALTVVLLDVPDTLGPFTMQRGGSLVSELCL